jgi:hypothetical protein
MDTILLGCWAGVLLATVLWWLIMLVRGAFIGPFELLAMFRKLNQPEENGISAEHDRCA